jgi:hypothetical protein
MQQAEWGSILFFVGGTRHAQKQGHMDELFPELRRMISASMLKEFLAVVGAESEYAFVPRPRSTQIRDQPLHLLIHPANASIVERNNFPPVPFKSAC